MGVLRGVEESAREWWEAGPAGWGPGTALVAAAGSLIMVAFVGFGLALRRTRLNWYERNLLEMAKEKEYVHYRLNRQGTGRVRRAVSGDSEDEATPALPPVDADDAAPSRLQRSKQQSRIYRDAPRPRLATHVASGIPDNVAEKFVVPKSRSWAVGTSMFANLDKAKLNRELYDVRADSSASEEQVVGECGSLKMGLVYDARLSLLTVSLRQAAELSAPRADGPPNPYFKVSLQKPQPEPASFTQQSKVYKGSRDPELSDDFFFDVAAGLLGQCKLEVLVMDWDSCSVDEGIGYCWLSLGRLEVPQAPEPATVFWAEVLPSDVGGDAFGEILFSVAYLSKAQRLTVSVFKARKLVAPADLAGLPDPSVRVTVLCDGRKLKRKKTSTKRATVHPQFNEALAFSIPKSSLVSMAVVVEVVHEAGALQPSRPLGQLSLPLSQCRDLWRALIRGDNSQARWYALEKPLPPTHH